jgi:hypothetical protein
MSRQQGPSRLTARCRVTPHGPGTGSDGRPHTRRGAEVDPGGRDLSCARGPEQLEGPAPRRARPTGPPQRAPSAPTSADGSSPGTTTHGLTPGPGPGWTSAKAALRWWWKRLCWGGRSPMSFATTSEPVSVAVAMGHQHAVTHAEGRHPSPPQTQHARWVSTTQKGKVLVYPTR